MIEVVAVGILAFLFGVAGTLLITKMLNSHDRRIAVLEAKEQDREKFYTDARGRQRQHHAYDTKEALENAMALLVSAEMDAEAMRARQETVLAILQVLRAGRNNEQR